MYIVQNRNIVAVGKKGPSYKCYKTYYALLKLLKKTERRRRKPTVAAERKADNEAAKKLAKIREKCERNAEFYERRRVK